MASDDQKGGPENTGRREFIRSTVTAGLGAASGLPLAGVVAPDSSAQTPESAAEINPARLRRITNELIAAISSAPFVDGMRRFKQTPVDKRVAFASASLTPTALAKAGVRFPTGMRITSRYFERGSPDIVQVTDAGALLNPGPLIPGPGTAGAWGCACGGGATFCAGAGGGT